MLKMSIGKVTVKTTIDGESHTVETPEKTVELKTPKPERATLKTGQWFMYSVNEPLPEKLTIFEGDVFHRKTVRTITRAQARALIRWHGDDWMAAYRDGNGRFRDVYIVGDIDAWYEDD